MSKSFYRLLRPIVGVLHQVPTGEGQVLRAEFGRHELCSRVGRRLKPQFRHGADQHETSSSAT